jgi:hypothetical protein
MTESGSPGPGGLPRQEAADVGLEILSVWQTPVPDVKTWRVPVFLLPRLAEMAAESPSPAEQSLGQALSYAFYKECSLADIVLASGLSVEQVVAIGKRTIRRRKWLRKLTELNRA